MARHVRGCCPSRKCRNAFCGSLRSGESARRGVKPSLQSCQKQILFIYKEPPEPIHQEQTALEKRANMDVDSASDTTSASQERTTEGAEEDQEAKQLKGIQVRLKTNEEQLSQEKRGSINPEEL